MAATLSLDTILSALFWALPKWTPGIKRNASRDLLRHLICQLYGASKGDLFNARVQASQDALGAYVGISREWTCKLLARLVEAGWLESYAPRLPDGHFLPCIFRPGGQLKRLLCVLMRYRRPRQSRVNNPSQSLPPKRDLKISFNFIQDLKATLAAKIGQGGSKNSP